MTTPLPQGRGWGSKRRSARTHSSRARMRAHTRAHTHTRTCRHMLHFLTDTGDVLFTSLPSNTVWLDTGCFCLVWLRQHNVGTAATTFALHDCGLGA